MTILLAIHKHTKRNSRVSHPKLWAGGKPSTRLPPGRTRKAEIPQYGQLSVTQQANPKISEIQILESDQNRNFTRQKREPVLQINLYLIILMYCDDLLAIHKHTKRNCHVSPLKNQVFFDNCENRKFWAVKTPASDLDKVVSGQSRRNHSLRHTWLYPEIDISSKSNEWNLFNFWFFVASFEILFFLSDSQFPLSTVLLS